MTNTRLGYACLNLTLRSKFKDVILKTLEKLSLNSRLDKLNSIALYNTSEVDQILKFNVKNDIGLYRIPTNLLPFPTHPIAKEWDWRKIMEPCFQYTGKFANQNKLRISFHADAYTVINSPSEKVFNKSAESLIYLSDVLDMMDVNGKIVVHVGGIYKNKEESLERFSTNYMRLPEHVRIKLVVENDDKQYSWMDVHRLCLELNLPQVLDIHHYKVYALDEPLTSDDIKDIFATWNGEKPKIHLSSPKSTNDMRAHADYININDYLWFYKLARQFDYDVMLEAKAKELAVLQFRRNLIKEYLA